MPPVESPTAVSDATSIHLSIAGEAVTLLPQRAAWWHTRAGEGHGETRCGGTLLISDLHLGKVETFASLGVPLPAVMERQLAQLSELIQRTRCRRVMILGDLLHAPAGLTQLMLDQVRTWRDTHDCEFAIVPGNHDRKIDKVADWWNMRLLGELHHEGPFAFTHEPKAIAGKFTWAGHVHPVVKLRTASDALKLWCFVVDHARQCAILPAFCDFTSGGRFERDAQTKVYAIAQGHVLEV